MPRRWAMVTAAPDVGRARLFAAQRTEALIGGVADQRLEAAPHRLGVARRADRRSGVAEQRLVDMQRLLHAISLWHFRMASSVSATTDLSSSPSRRRRRSGTPPDPSLRILKREQYFRGFAEVAGHLSVSQFTTVKAESRPNGTPCLLSKSRRPSAAKREIFAERDALRGFDALHLASFSAVARRAGASQTDFASFDVKLNRAAADIVRRLGSMG